MTTTARFLAGGFDHPEGVAWDPAGFLVTGGEAGQIYRVPIDVEFEKPEVVASTGGAILGIALDADQRAYVCDCGLAKVLRVDLRTGAFSEYGAGTSDEPMVTPNHLVFDSRGRLYVSDSGNWGAGDGKIWRIDPSGECRVVSRETAQFPNGLAIDPTGAYLYVVESTLPGITRHPIDAAGDLGPRETVLGMPRVVPDGIAFTADGRLVITCFRPDRVYFWSGGELEILVDDWRGVEVCAPTNAAFFGDALTRLAVANIGETFLAEVVGDFMGADLNRPSLP